jgi:hypothetical protein
VSERRLFIFAAVIWAIALTPPVVFVIVAFNPFASAVL